MCLSNHSSIGYATVAAKYLLVVCWLMCHRPTGDRWQEPTNAMWLPMEFLKKVIYYSKLSFTVGMIFCRSAANLKVISGDCKIAFPAT